ncbi:PAS domain S-box protein [bacterium]|nr:PAS domain S-box protein [bacterium]
MADEFLFFSQAKDYYDQIRYIDSSGMEIIRIDRASANPRIIPTDQLQNKSDRYYFKETMELDRNGLFASPLDLNVENGVVEEPHKPMIRFCRPVFDSTGIRQGMVVLNFKAAKILDTIDTTRFMLLNSDGFYPTDGPQGAQWGFMLPHGRSLALENPSLWSICGSHDRGQTVHRDSLVTFIAVKSFVAAIADLNRSNDARAARKSESHYSDYEWKLVSIVPPLTELSGIILIRHKFRVYFGMVFCLLAAVFTLLALSLRKRSQSERQLKLAGFALNNSADFIRRVDRQARHVYVNNAICEATGYSRTELLAKSVFEINPEIKPDEWDSLWEKVKSSGFSSCETSHRSKDGAVFPVEVTATHMVFEGQEYLFLAGRNIADRKKAETALRESEKRLESVQNAATQVSIITTDPDGIIQVLNSGAERMLGYTAAEMIGKQSPALVHLESEVVERGRQLSVEPGYEVRGFDVFVERTKSGNFEEREWTYVRKDGGRLTVNLIVTAVRNEQCEITGFLGVAQDFTANRKAMPTTR